MKLIQRFAAPLSGVALFHIYTMLVALPTATAQDTEILLAELGGVSVVSIPQPSPLPGLLATKVVLRTASENSFVTFENVKIAGAVHQVWIPDGGDGPPHATPHVDSITRWSFVPREWKDADSHLLITPSMVAGGVGGGHSRIHEANDLSNPAIADEVLPILDKNFPLYAVEALTGIGDIDMLAETDAFYVEPRIQTNAIDFAYVVTPDESTGTAGDVFLTVGVLGAGIINSGQPGGASFGFNGNYPVAIFPLIPEPATRVLAATAFVTCLGIRRRFISREAS